jgi:hypothetical protein
LRLTCGSGDPADFAQHAGRKAKGSKHFHGPAGDAIGLPELQRTRLLIDGADLDVGKCRKLGSERHARRTSADDQHVHLFGQRIET